MNIKKFNLIKGMEAACRDLKEFTKDSHKERLLIGITGPVAVGKTRFAQEFIESAKAISQCPVIHLPFDLWINPKNLNAKLYRERFFLNEFVSAMRCLKEKMHFMVPRYDLYKQGWAANRELTGSTVQSVFWQGFSFNKIEVSTVADLEWSCGLYLETTSWRPHSFFPNSGQSIYITDGTLVAPKELLGVYDMIIFVTAPWVYRVANMVRRFNRQEVFGITSGSLQRYIEFLIDEARSCADQEIYAQLNQTFLEMEYLPMTLSNYLDLWYLKELILKSPDLTRWVSLEEVEQEINQFLKKLKTEYNPEILQDLHRELEHLVLTKHLLCLDAKNEILRKLFEMLG